MLTSTTKRSAGASSPGPVRSEAAPGAGAQQSQLPRNIAAHRSIESRRELAVLAAAVVVALLVRLPGIWWGSNFTFGWTGHHPDEYTHVLHAQLMINPKQPKHDADYPEPATHPWAAGWSVTPYPRGLAAHVAVPALLARGVQRRLGEPPPATAEILPWGRLICVCYGAASVVVLFLLAKHLFRSSSVALLSAWLLALGGLHVSQSHFFVSDVPALFWFLSGMLFLYRDLDRRHPATQATLAAAAFCCGAAFGLKLFVAGVPAVAVAALARRHRVWRAAVAFTFFVGGTTLVTFGSFGPPELRAAVVRGVTDPWTFSRSMGALFYLLELPSMVSVPVFLSAVAGACGLLVKLLRTDDVPRRNRILLVVLLPLGLHLLLVLLKVDHFPRHFLPFLPFLAMCSAWALVGFTDWLVASARIPRVAVFGALFLYLAAFVYDGERGYLDEPRNRAARWIQANVAQGSTLWWYWHGPRDYVRVDFPAERPSVIVEEMHHANHYLSGMGWRGSLPKDHRQVFDVNSQEHLEALQSLFEGDGGYREAARFQENYFMPEYVLTDWLLGNRSRNYLAEVVVFVRDGDEPAVESPN